MLTYAYTLTPDSNGTYLVQYPDFPEGAAVSETDHGGEAAAEGLEAALQLYIDARRPIPMPSGVGDGAVDIGAMETAKILLANEMVRQGVRKADLARRLGLHAPQVDRLLDLSHNSKMDAIEAACIELGKRLDVSLT